MVEYASQALAHAAVAALVVEALLRLWQVTEPQARITFRLIPILLPITVLPALLVAAPDRSGDVFRDRWAVFASARWGAAGVLGVMAAAVLGIALFLFDVLRFARSAMDSRLGRSTPAVRAGTDGSGGHEPSGAPSMSAAVRLDVEDAARRLRVAPPPVVVLETRAPVLHVAGVRRPRLIVSRGTLERLDDDERRAAVAHEVAHVARRDPVFGWFLMLCRALAIFNPVVQLVVRTVVRELEWRADDLAVVATGDTRALASGLGKLFSATETDDGDTRGVLARGRAAAIELRRRRLLHGPPPAAIAFQGLRVAMTAVSLTLLLFFVV
jgi:Zn-dependent protease with chaperone function